MRGDDGPQGSPAVAYSHQISHNGSSNLPSLPPISVEISKAVFTHQSAVSNGHNKNQSDSYERLEFVGDAYIELMATRLVWDKFKDLPAGRLSQIRESLVTNETLGKIAAMYGLDKRLALAHDVRTNSKQWAKVKGDLVEAYVAAIVLPDEGMGGAGFAVAEKWLHQLWMPKLENMLEKKAPDLNAKDALSRKVVSRGVKLEYLEERPMKLLKGGQQTYFIGAFLTGWGYDKQHLGSGQALNKSGAGNLAAEDALGNPLVEEISGRKRGFDELAKGRHEDEDATVPVIDSQAAQERINREREQVEKKRSLFMSSELG